MQVITPLSDEDLVARLVACCAAGRRLTAETLVLLNDVEERRVYLAAASPSMFDWCQRRLGMSPGRAYRHIAGSRLVRRYPFLLERIARGEVFLSTLTHLASFLTDENIHDLLAETHGRNRSQIDTILGRRFGVERPKSYRFGPQLSMDDELESLMSWARDHFSNAIPDGDVTKLTKRVFSELKTRIEREQRAVLALPKPPAMGEKTKRIPRRNAAYVEARDGGQCAYIDPETGKRCPAKAYLQKDHVVGQADGGAHDVDNLRCACRAHNLWFAELRYGKAYVQKRIRLRQQKRAVEKETPES